MFGGRTVSWSNPPVPPWFTRAEPDRYQQPQNTGFSGSSLARGAALMSALWGSALTVSGTTQPSGVVATSICVGVAECQL